MMEDSGWRDRARDESAEETVARAPERAPSSTPPAREETGFERTLQGPGSERSRTTRPGSAERPPPRIPDVRIDALLGRGGQGVVYRGRQTYLERDVAVKVLHAGADEDFEQRFRREARILAGLSDPHIVACYQAGVTEEGSCYLVMEFIDGPDLARWIEAHGKLGVRDALVLARDVARALEHAHSVGILHRDVKPQNVLLAPSTVAASSFPFRAKLADLGLARGGAGELALTQLTAPGAIMGTPSTMAPEQFDDAGSVDFRADIYGLGCVLYHALVGQCAYTGQTLGQVIRRKSSGDAPDPSKLNPDVPTGVSRLVQRMLATNREERPGDYAALVEELDAQIAALAAPARQPDSRARRRLARPWPVAALVASVVGAWWLWPESEEPAPSAVAEAEPARESFTASVGAPAPDEAELASTDGAPLEVVSKDSAPSRDASDTRPTLPSGSLWRPFEAWTSLEELLAVDGWRRTQPEGRAVWGCVEGELDALLANSPSGLATATRELMRGAWTLRGELSARRAFGWESQEARAGLRIVLDGERALEWECSASSSGSVARWRNARRDGADWRAAPDASSSTRVLDASSLRFECDYDGRELSLSLVRDEVPEPVTTSRGVARELELYVEGGMGQWSAFEFSIH
mgnify:CR=1 FL=1